MIAGPRLTGWPLTALAVIGALAASTLVVALIEAVVEIENASAMFLVAVSAIAIIFGTWPAVATAIGAFVLYNFFFVDPRNTLTVSRPEELLTLVLLLFVGVVISRLAGLQRQREQEAQRREREARALFGISRELVRTERLGDAMQAVAERLTAEAGMTAVWAGLGLTVATERVVARTRSSVGGPLVPSSHFVLHRDAAEGSARWVRIHPPTGGMITPVAAAPARGRRFYRVELRAGADVVGSLWAERDHPHLPHIEETRLLAAAADQLGAAVRRDRLLAQAAELEIVRRSEELKSAFVDSVSHDLRTPLATIRAAAGSLADPAIDLPPDERHAIAAAIDEEADRLNRLVGDLLDMSRIQGGALTPDLEIVPLDELVRPAVERASSGMTRPIEARLPVDLPEVRVDAALLDRVLDNLLENAVKYAGERAAIRVTAAVATPQTVALTIEDGGPGVPDESLETIFERFSRLDSAERARRGFGLGLAITRGLTEAMGGTVTAGRSELGGLSVTLRLPAVGPRPS